MFERFAKDAREAVVQAQDEARTLGVDRIGPEHVLLGAVRSPDTVAAQALGRLGVDHASLLAAVRALPAHAIDADALAGIGIDLEAVRAQVEASFGPGALDAVTGSAPDEGPPAVRRRRQEAARGRAARGDPLQAPPDRQRSPAAGGRPPGRHRRLPGARRGRRRTGRRARGRHRRVGRRAGGLTVTAWTLSTVLRTRAWASGRPRPVAPTAGLRPRTRQSLVTGENRSSSRLTPSVPKSTLATAFGPAPSSAMTVPSPYESCVTRSPTDSCGMAESGRGLAEPKVAPVDGSAGRASRSARGADDAR